MVSDTGVQIVFSGVTEDSRCPGNAICVRLGDAIVHLRVIEINSTSESDLHTEPGRAAAITHGALRITLVHVLPYPFTDRTIAPGDYRATLTVANR